MKPRTIWIGFDRREAAAFAVARQSIAATMHAPILPRGVILDELREAGLYTRPTSRRAGVLWDDLSEAPMSTEFAISRFFVYHLARSVAGGGWALFMDCDVLVRANLTRLFAMADDSKAVMCVKHRHEPVAGAKMDGQLQTAYPRKNWSSVMLINCDHMANQALTLDLLNTAPGRDLHAFCWLPDDLIGELPAEWNWLVGHSNQALDPAVVHFTDGFPLMSGYESQPYADEWRGALAAWARGPALPA